MARPACPLHERLHVRDGAEIRLLERDDKNDKMIKMMVLMSTGEGRSTHCRTVQQQAEPFRVGRRPAGVVERLLLRSKLRRRPSEAAAGVRHRAAAPRLCEPSPVHLRAPYAHAVRTVPKPVLRAGGRVVATAPAPSSARGSSAIVIVRPLSPAEKTHIPQSLPVGCGPK